MWIVFLVACLLSFLQGEWVEGRYDGFGTRWDKSGEVDHNVTRTVDESSTPGAAAATASSAAKAKEQPKKQEDEPRGGLFSYGQPALISAEPRARTQSPEIGPSSPAGSDGEGGFDEDPKKKKTKKKSKSAKSKPKQEGH